MSARAQTDVCPPLPHNLEAERSILGAVILDNHALSPAAEKLRADDFFLPEHRKIFKSMVDLAEKQQGIDTITLMEELEHRNELESSGGVAYLSKLADGLPRVTNVEYYAHIVKEKAVLRSLAYSAAAIQEQALAGVDPPEAVVARAREMISKLEESSSWEALFDTWEEFQNAKPLRSLIENIFQADVCNVVGGLSGDGKTLILFSVTKALLTGEPLFGYFRVLEKAARVIYLIPECARAPFFHRAKLFHLEKYIENGRLLVRTLSKGLRIPLSDPRLLNAVKGTVVLIDTAIRFSTGEENDAGAVSNGLAADIFGLIAAGAAAVGAAHHAPKGFEKENRITLENILRGSGDFGAFIGAGFGIRQIDEMQNIIHLQDIKPRESEPFPPFQIIGRPYINSEGDFRMHRNPNDCGPLADYLEIPSKNRGGASAKDRENKASNLEHLRTWLKQDPELNSKQLAARFKTIDVIVSPDTIRGYKRTLQSEESDDS